MRSRTILFGLVLAACGSSRASEPATSSGGEAAAVDEGAAPATTTTGNAILDAHNARRAAHCAPPLAWSDALAQHAQSWADHLAASGCNLEHSRSSYGENLAAGTSGTLGPEEAVEMWYAESAAYDYARGDFSMQTGHFTQLVWTTSTSLGCAMARCESFDVWVCNYDPPGNFEGELQAHVLPTSCSR